MPEVTRQPDAADDAIQADLRCQGCAYNLRGLAPDGRCPECGAPIGVSLYGNELAVADPAWLAKLERGAAMPTLALFALLSTAAIGAIGGAAAAFLEIGKVGQWLTAVALGASLLIAALGFWWVTTPHRVLALEESVGSPRRVARHALGVGLGLTLGGLLIILGVPAYRPVANAAFALGAPFGVCAVIGAWGYCTYLRGLALRCGDLFTAGRVRAYLAIFVCSWSLLAVGAILLAFGLVGGGCMLAPGIAGYLGAGALILFLPGYIARPLRRAHARARRNWRVAAGAPANDAGPPADPAV